MLFNESVSLHHLCQSEINLALLLTNDIASRELKSYFYLFIAAAVRDSN